MAKDLLVIRVETPLPTEKFREVAMYFNKNLTSILNKCDMECVFLPHNMKSEIHTDNSDIVEAINGLKDTLDEIKNKL